MNTPQNKTASQNIKYKGYEIQKTYCVIDKDGTGNDYAFTLANAKKCVDRLIEELKSQKKEQKA